MLLPYTASRSPASPCLGKPCDTIRQALPRPARARSENSWRPASRPALPDWRNAPPIRTAGAAAPGPVWPRHHLAGALLLRAFRPPPSCHGLADRQGRGLPHLGEKATPGGTSRLPFSALDSGAAQCGQDGDRHAQAARERFFSFPAAQAWPAGSVPSRSPACEPPVSRHRRGARGQARWGHRRSAAREWLAEAALPAMASARSAERAKAVPTAHRAVGTAFQNLASAGSQAPCLRPPSGRQSSCTRRKCCRSGAYAPGCSGPWRAREPCAWPRGKSAW